MTPLDVQITRTDEQFRDVPMPAYATAGAAGLDVCAAIDVDVVLKASSIILVPTALALAIPIGYECQVRSRSGLAAKNGVFCLNAPGTIDSDYRGEVKVILANFSQTDFVIHRGDRIAQLVIARVEHVRWHVVDELDETHRGDGGFGSTGSR